MGSQSSLVPFFFFFCTLLRCCHPNRRAARVDLDGRGRDPGRERNFMDGALSDFGGVSHYSKMVNAVHVRSLFQESEFESKSSYCHADQKEALKKFSLNVPR